MNFPLGNTMARRTGLGMVEVLVSSVLVGVMLVAALNTVEGVYRHRRLSRERKIGQHLAMQLMTEIMALPYKDPDSNSTSNGLEAGEVATARDTFDDVDDFDGWDQTNPQAADGTPLADYAGWRRGVKVYWWSSEGGSVSLLADLGLKRIVITVTSPEGDATELRGYRSRQGMLQQPPGVDMTVVNWLQAELQIGTDGTLQRTSRHLVNHCTDSN